ncbi:hypothetical protein TRVA0_007S01662 [Trichomonascus vanleenenianus]|uniref:Siz/PIAS RING finger protein n=1 Tax=Trichomonascus vanleenenianus TaxID=2268995 RepID=UPI003ECA9324
MASELIMEYEKTLKIVDTLKVAQLKSVLRGVKLSQSGLKAVLVSRLKDYLHNLVRAKDLPSMKQARTLCQQEVDYDRVRTQYSHSPMSAGTTYTNEVNSISRRPNAPTVDLSRQNPTAVLDELFPPRATGQYQPPSHHHHRPNQLDEFKTLEVNFRPSPFYTLVRKLHDYMPFLRSRFYNDRLTLARNFVLQGMELDAVLNDTYAVYLVSTTYDELIKLRSSVVQFPQTLDIRVNNEQVVANTRGVKNKPGSTLPANITEYVRNAYLNQNKTRHTVDIIVAKPQSDFVIAAFLAKPVPVADIVSGILARPMFTKESVIKRIQEDSKDEEIEAMATFHSLRDPVSFTRIKNPIRSSMCHHIDCLDAETFIMLQLQAPTWICSICNKQIEYPTLALDGYIKDILEKTDEDVTEVEIHPDGSWAPPKEVKGEEDYSDSDEDMFKPPQRHPQGSGRSMAEPIVVDLIDDDDEEEEEQEEAAAEEEEGQTQNAATVANGHQNATGTTNTNDGNNANNDAMNYDHTTTTTTINNRAANSPYNYESLANFDFGDSILTLPRGDGSGNTANHRRSFATSWQYSPVASESNNGLMDAGQDTPSVNRTSSIPNGLNGSNGSNGQSTNSTAPVVASPATAANPTANLQISHKDNQSAYVQPGRQLHANKAPTTSFSHNASGTTGNSPEVIDLTLSDDDD